MEIEFNELFDAYREMYFEGGTSSVYLWDQDQGFAGCFLIKKSKCFMSVLIPACAWLSTRFRLIFCGCLSHPLHFLLIFIQTWKATGT